MITKLVLMSEKCNNKYFIYTQSTKDRATSNYRTRCIHSYVRQTHVLCLNTHTHRETDKEETLTLFLTSCRQCGKLVYKPTFLTQWRQIYTKLNPAVYSIYIQDTQRLCTGRKEKHLRNEYSV